MAYPAPVRPASQSQFLVNLPVNQRQLGPLTRQSSADQVPAAPWKGKKKKKATPTLPPPPPPSQNSKYVHLQQFFAFYPEYRYNQTKPVMEEFYSMSKKVGMKPDEEAEAVRDLQEAVAKTFNMLYGTVVDDFSAWEKMYRALNPDPDPVDLSDLDICRYRVKTTFFNIYNLIDASCAGETVLSFSNREQLDEHTNTTQQWFSTDTQSLSDLLRYLLRHIIAAPNSNPEVYLEAFFAQYRPFKFEYCPSMPVMAEFYRLCEHMHWTRRYRGFIFGGPTTSIEEEGKQKVKDEELQKAKEGIQSAIAKTFNDMYGVDRHDLRSWQKLCRTLRLDPILTTLNDCHDHIRATHVNICNLIDVPRIGEPAKLFESEKALSDYTKSNGEYFPKDHAEAGGILRFLLRRIEHPREGPEGDAGHGVRGYGQGPKARRRARNAARVQS